MPMIGIGLDLSGQGSGGALPSEVVFEEPLVSSSTLNGYTLVVWIRMDDPDINLESPSIEVTGIQIEVEGKVDKVYVGVRDSGGDDYDAVSLTQVTFEGNPGIDPATATDVSTSDIIPFVWDGTSDLIFSIYTGVANNKIRNKSFTDFATLYAKSGVDEADVADKTDYSTVLAENLYCIRSVIVYTL